MYFKVAIINLYRNLLIKWSPKLVRYIRAIAIVLTFNREFLAICFIINTKIVSFESRGVNPTGSVTQYVPNSTLYATCSYLCSQPTCSVAIYLSSSLTSSSYIFPWESCHRKWSFLSLFSGETNCIMVKIKNIPSIENEYSINFSFFFIFDDLIGIDRSIVRFVFYGLPSWRNSLYRIAPSSYQWRWKEKSMIAKAKRMAEKEVEAGGWARASVKGFECNLIWNADWHTVSN